jgi:trehalose synthase
VKEIHVASLSLEPLHELLDQQERGQLDRDIQRARELLTGRVVWNINSTAVGGVAEMLQSLLAYTRGAGVDARWLVIRGDKPFFRVTKRLHNWA